MSKILFDKYYTGQKLADYCTQKAVEVIGKENIIELIEPSAGNGVFLNSFEKLLPNTPVYAYDLFPEREDIKEQDYLKLDLEYKKGRCVIGNPPYGSKNNLSKAFCNKSFEIAEYVCFILPISQLNNTQSIYKYDLVYSEDLGKQFYTDVKVWCCLNIYKKPMSGEFNNKINYKNSEIIEIREVIKNNNPKRNRELGDFKYDIAICAWGSLTGTFCNEGDYAKTFYIKIHKHKEKVIKLLKEVKWQEIYPMTATPNLLQWQVYKYIKEQIIELE